MKYAKVENGALVAYPYTLRDFKRDNPGVSPPNDLGALSEWGVVPVTDPGKPQPSDWTIVEVEELPPVEVNGVWTVQYTEVPCGDQEAIRRQKVRDQRDFFDEIKNDPALKQLATRGSTAT